MTVINMMSFGESGAAVADEQSSILWPVSRKYNVAQKLRMIEDIVIYGGSGHSDIINEIFDDVGGALKKRKEKEGVEISSEMVYGYIKAYVFRAKNDHKNEFLEANFGISLEEFQTGVKDRGRRLDDSFKAKVTELLDKYSREFQVSVILGGICDGRFEIFHVNSSGDLSKKIPRPYASIGSGAEESDRILSQYVANMPREQRDKVPVEEGLVKLIEATNGSSNLNIGVGGNPSIVYLNKNGEVKEPNESQCILASEIVEGFTRGFLDRDFVYGAVRRLVLENADFRTVEKEMQQQAKDWDKLDRILRGYKE